ncbi:hypothetical protein GCM10023149_13830 [Mucilaginibacter gynuensis]|uniref:Acyltransferase 3 domain-containing protein n=1 Tax=Mucilaginibacter gynuensis TaxID=1302236 RepID=A0ABP8G3M6_9SPHI
MNKLKSLYLEILRISAAFYVFIFHVGSVTIGGERYFATTDFNDSLGLSNLGAHYFVVVFFVLSGFLITMSVNKPGVTIKSFFIARLGRLYSVLIPALIFSFVVSFVIIYSGSIPAELIKNNEHLVIRFFMNLLFLTQSWTLCSTPPLNDPFWSVTYEFIYYALIAVITLVKNSVFKWLVLGFIVLVGFPKVILLFPAWLAGSLLYFVSKKVSINKGVSAVLFLLSLAGIIAVIINPELVPFTKNESDNQFLGFNLLFSWNYLADFVYSLLIAANIYFLFSVADSNLFKGEQKLITKLHDILRLVGNCTYTLYLFHLPLLFLFASLLPYDRTNYLYPTGLIAATLLSVFIIARYTEWKVDFWRSVMERTFNLFSSLFKGNLKTSKI